MATLPSPSNASNFHKFQSLPMELRTKIWEELIYVGPRTIAVFFKLYRKIKVRFNRGCSHQDHRHGLFSSHDASQLLGAYFHTNYPEVACCVFPPESVDTNSSLSQVNHEARSHVRTRYPVTIRIYDGRGEFALHRTKAKSRLIHFNPATDLVALQGGIHDLEDHDPLWVPDAQVVLSPESKFPHPAESIATVRLLERVAIPSDICDSSCDEYFVNDADNNEPRHSTVGKHFCHRHEAMALGYMDSLREVWIYPARDDAQYLLLHIPHEMSEDEICRAITACDLLLPYSEYLPPFIEGRRMMEVLQARLTESDIPYLKANHWTPQLRVDPTVGMLTFRPTFSEDNPIPSDWEELEDIIEDEDDEDDEEDEEDENLDNIIHDLSGELDLSGSDDTSNFLELLADGQLEDESMGKDEENHYDHDGYDDHDED